MFLLALRGIFNLASAKHVISYIADRYPCAPLMRHRSGFAFFCVGGRGRAGGRMDGGGDGMYSLGLM